MPGATTLALLVICLLGGCKGTITSTEPLLLPRDASFPLPPVAAVTGQRLDDDNVWERDPREARVDLVDRSYRVTSPDQSGPSPDRFLFKDIGEGEFIVQASNGSDWAYGLIVHADMYYLFAFNRGQEKCTDLSAPEQGKLRVVVRDDRCYVARLGDLVGLLRYLRQKFPHPTSAFTVRNITR